MSGPRPSTLKANQTASLAPFPQAHAQNLGVLICDNANGQDEKYVYFSLRPRAESLNETIFFWDPTHPGFWL